MREDVRALGYARDMIGYTHTVRYDNCTIGWDTDNIDNIEQYRKITRTIGKGVISPFVYCVRILW